MRAKQRIVETREPEKSKIPEVDIWLNKINKLSLINAFNPNEIRKTLSEATTTNSPVPFILTLCPAIENLEKPNSKGQTRRLIPLTTDLPRLKMAIQEIVSFMIFTKRSLNLDSEIFLIFADSLEKEAENMFVNVNEMPAIANQSLKGVRKAFAEVDQENPGLIQESQIRIPKIRKQSSFMCQSGKIGKNREQIMDNKELEMLDPLNPLFEVWKNQLILTRKDASFVSTGWQNKNGAQSIWNRARFLLAEFMADGEILPQLMAQMNKKRFPSGMPKPIFLASSTRLAGVKMEIEGFNAKTPIGVLSPFQNIGRWVDQPKKSGWLEM